MNGPGLDAVDTDASRRELRRALPPRRSADCPHRLGEAAAQEPRPSTRGDGTASFQAVAVLVAPGYETVFEFLRRLRRCPSGRPCPFHSLARRRGARRPLRRGDRFRLPSLAEGFGLPVLDALARGVPVACSDTVVACRRWPATRCALLRPDVAEGDRPRDRATRLRCDLRGPPSSRRPRAGPAIQLATRQRRNDCELRARARRSLIASPHSVSLSIDVVIPTYNGWELTESCLRHLARQTLPHTVVVADNASTDGTPERLRTAFPDAKLVEIGDNLGFAVATNRGRRSRKRRRDRPAQQRRRR